MGCGASSRALNAATQPYDIVDDEILQITKRLHISLDFLKEVQENSTVSDKEKLKCYERTERCVSECLRKIITLAKPKSSKFNCAVLDQLLVAINSINRNEPVMARKLSWLLTTCLHLIEERTVVTEVAIGDIGVRFEPSAGAGNTSNPSNHSHVRINTTSLWETVAFHMEPLPAGDGAISSRPAQAPQQQAKANANSRSHHLNSITSLNGHHGPSLRGLDTSISDCSSDFGFFDMSQHSSGSGRSRDCRDRSRSKSKGSDSSYHNLAFLASLPMSASSPPAVAVAVAVQSSGKASDAADSDNQDNKSKYHVESDGPVASNGPNISTGDKQRECILSASRSPSLSPSLSVPNSPSRTISQNIELMVRYSASYLALSSSLSTSSSNSSNSRSSSRQQMVVITGAANDHFTTSTSTSTAKYAVGMSATAATATATAAISATAGVTVTTAAGTLTMSSSSSSSSSRKRMSVQSDNSHQVTAYQSYL